MTEQPSEATDDLPEWGAAMSALSDKRRAFVIAMYDSDAPEENRGLQLFAARAAGYGTPTSSDKSLGVIACRIWNDPRVQAAAAEYAKTHVRMLAPSSVRAVRDAIKNPRHKDHIRAAAMVWDRVDPLQTNHHVVVEDRRPPPPEMTERVLARIEELMARVGLPSKPAPVIDAEFHVVDGDAA